MLYNKTMIEKAQNKMIQKEDVKNKEKGYFFPDFGITVSAESQEEANKKLQVIINKK